MKELSIEELLSGVSSVGPVASNEVELWLTEAGISPGQTRCNSTEMYLEFVAWWRKHYEKSRKIPSQTSWGRIMGKRFRKGHGRDGDFYYIHRGDEAQRVEKLVGALENGGGDTP